MDLKMKKSAKLLWTAFILSVLVPAPGVFGGDLKGDFSPDELGKIYGLSPVPQVPEDKTDAYADNASAAELGKTIFFDKRFSGSGNVSCATCHNPNLGWSDGNALPKIFSSSSLTGAKGRGKRRVPSLWNLGYNHWFFWDGRSDSLWSQALGPFENPKEMEGGSRLQYVHQVYDDQALRKQYEQLFGKMPDLSDKTRFPLKACPVPDDPKCETQLAWESMAPGDQDKANRVYANLGKSVEAFERKIVSRDSRFDVYVEGLKENNPVKLAVFTEHEKNGLKLFIGKARCLVCHSGPNFTDGAFHNIRVPSKSESTAVDLGRFAGIPLVKANLFNGAGIYSDDHSPETKDRLESLKAKPITRGQFKTPGLRNVAQFAPYMHQGQTATLREVVRYYSTLQGAQPLMGPDEGLLVATHLSDEEIDDLTAFLKSLTDESANASLVPH
jgi:cytochrome c peroxidase